MVKAFASRAGDPETEARFPRRGHASDFKSRYPCGCAARRLVLQVSARTGVRRLVPDETASLIYSFYLSVAAGQIV